MFHFLNIPKNVHLMCLPPAVSLLSVTDPVVGWASLVMGTPVKAHK